MVSIYVICVFYKIWFFSLTDLNLVVFAEKSINPPDNKDLKELEDTVNENKDEIIGIFS